MRGKLLQFMTLRAVYIIKLEMDFFFCGGAVVEGSPVHVKLAEMANLVKWIRTL